MARKCPPNVLCFDNITLFVLLSFISVIIYLVYTISQRNIVNVRDYNISNEIDTRQHDTNPYFNKQNTLFSNSPNDVFMNPYNPPLKTNPFYNPTNIPDVRGSVPINIQTNGYDVGYTQVGIATRSDGPEKILAVFGRPLHANRNKWHNIKLPISKGGRTCTGTTGCDEMYNSDTVYVEGYKDKFNVVIYDNIEPRYIPYV